MKKVREVPVYKPLITADEIQASTEALENGWLGMGSYTQEFEKKIESILGHGDYHAIAVSTGHAALHLALLLIGVGPGDEVLTPSFNNIADFQAISATGAKPVFCDITENLTIDVDKARELIGPKVKAIVVLDYNFCLAEHEKIKELGKQKEIPIIHDAAHTIGSLYKGKSIGTIHDYTMFSFDAVKTFTCIDGGILVVKDPDQAAALREMRLIGQGQAPAILYKNKREWKYDVTRLGFRYHLANLHAAIGLKQLEKIDQIRESRVAVCHHYQNAFEGVEGIMINYSDFEDIIPFMYHIRVGSDQRDDFRAFLSDRGIGTGLHWQPGHWFSMYKNCRRGDLHVSDRVGGEIVTLPFHSCMDEEDFRFVSCAVEEFFGR